MRLKEFIKVLERLPARTPIGLGPANSWRGNYELVAFEPRPGTTASEVLVFAQHAVGATFAGYKGGTFTVGEETLCYVNAYGQSDGPTVGEYMTLLLLTWLEEKTYG